MPENKYIHRGSNSGFNCSLGHAKVPTRQLNYCEAKKVTERRKKYVQKSLKLRVLFSMYCSLLRPKAETASNTYNGLPKKDNPKRSGNGIHQI